MKLKTKQVPSRGREPTEQTREPTSAEKFRFLPYRRKEKSECSPAFFYLKEGP